MKLGSKGIPTTDLVNRIPDWAVLVGFFLIFGCQVVLSAKEESATFDEPVNLASGYVELTTGDYRIEPQNLPLVKQIAALPLLFLKVRYPVLPRPWDDSSRSVFAYDFLYKFNDADRLLMLGRLALLPLSLLLGCGIFFWSKQLFGKGAAFFALFLFAFEPNILAHSGLVTTDLATGCFVFLTVLALYRLARKMTVVRLLCFALAFGFSLLTKFSALPLVIISVSLVFIVGFSNHPLEIRLKKGVTKRITGSGQKLLAFFLAFLLTGLVAYGMIWAAYRFSYHGTLRPELSYPRPWSVILPKRPLLLSIVAWVRRESFLPEPYIYGFCYLLMKSGAFIAYLHGHIRQGGWWYYFLVTFLIKTPVPLILLLFLALPILWQQRKEHPLTAPLTAPFLVGPLLIYLGMISISGWNIGHRHLLPIYPFIFVLVSALIPWAAEQKGLIKGGFAALAVWYLFSSVSIFPHYLAYFNEVIGGPANGYKYLVDSNLDWGQDLKGLKRYMERHKINQIWLSYFGNASPDYYGINYNYLPSYGVFEPKNVYKGAFKADRLPPFPGIVAISATNLQGIYLPYIGLKSNYFEIYRSQRPIAKIGYSIFVYRLE